MEGLVSMHHSKVFVWYSLDRLHADCVPSSRRCARCLPCPEAQQPPRRM